MLLLLLGIAPACFGERHQFFFLIRKRFSFVSSPFFLLKSDQRMVNGRNAAICYLDD